MGQGWDGKVGRVKNGIRRGTEGGSRRVKIRDRVGSRVKKDH